MSHIFPAVAIGCFSTAVLNLNNMRDIENDEASGKNTLVVKLGLKRAKVYHLSLFILAYISLAIFIFIETKGVLCQILYGIVAIIAIVHLRHLQTVKKSRSYKTFDPQLKVVALSSFLLSLLWFLAIYWFLN